MKKPQVTCPNNRDMVCPRREDISRLYFAKGHENSNIPKQERKNDAAIGAIALTENERLSRAMGCEGPKKIDGEMSCLPYESTKNIAARKGIGRAIKFFVGVELPSRNRVQLDTDFE